MRTPAKRDMPATARRRLAEIVSTRRDHPAYVGILTRSTRLGVAVEWQDSFSREHGTLVVVPRTMDFLPIVEAALEELHFWRKECGA